MGKIVYERATHHITWLDIMRMAYKKFGVRVRSIYATQNKEKAWSVQTARNWLRYAAMEGLYYLISIWISYFLIKSHLQYDDYMEVRREANEWWKSHTKDGIIPEYYFVKGVSDAQQNAR